MSNKITIYEKGVFIGSIPGECCPKCGSRLENDKCKICDTDNKDMSVKSKLQKRFLDRT